MFDLISIGDCVIDTFLKLHDADIRCSLNKEECKICIEYGEKIPLEEAPISLVAGNAANNAVGGSRLDLKTAIYVNVGDDDGGERTIKKFKEEKVDTRYVVVNKGMQNNYHTVLNFQGERTILIYHQPWKYNLPDLDKTKWVYFTSMSPSFTQSNIVSQLVQYLQRPGARLLYNPGTYQLNHGVKKDPQLLSLTELFIINKEEAKKILGYKEEENVSIKKLLKGIVDLGPKMVVITDGGEGSYGFDGENYFHLGIFPAKLVEMTGAGDGFATATLAGLFHGKDLPEAMRWGAANGASVVEQVGPQAGLLTHNQMLEKLKENKNIVAKEVI